jgi:hypothetical protein
MNRCNRYELSRTWRALVVAGDVVEIRTVDHRGLTTAGYFSLWENLAPKFGPVLAQAERVEFTLNPVDRTFISNRGQRFAHNPEHGGSMAPGWTGPLATDADIVQRRWLLVRFAPPILPNETATDDQRGTCRAKLDEAYGQLRAEGWPEGLIADGGHSWDLLYRVDLPTDDGGLLHRVLVGLRERYGDDVVDIDTNAPPAQLCRFYGSMVREGGPYRMSRLEHWPNECGIVSRALLDAIAPRKSKRTRSRA